tara:strand:- start:6402 stop:8234 length:1833 start_codon:yes stop_codon:yes gene_type:complete
MTLLKRLLFMLLFTGFVYSEIYDISIPENDTASYTYADFRIWVNDSTDTLRGIYWFMHPNNGDSRNIVTDSAYQTLVNGKDFALMGAHIFNMNMDTGIGDAVIAAMDSLAIMTQHEEFNHLPFFINGYSWGGQFGYHFTKWIPERVIGFITQKGGYHDTSDAGDAIEVPGLMFVGENDQPYRIDNLTGIFLDHRPLGAKWILAMEQGAGHTLVTDDILDSFFNTVADHRLEENVNVFEPITLVTFPDSLGWLGDQNTWIIGSWECFNGEYDSSSWFPSRSVGEQWQNFVSEDWASDTSICDPVFDSSYVFFTVGIHEQDDQSNFTIATNNEDLINQSRSQLDLPEDERLLHINGYLNYESGGFNEPWNWHIIPNEWALAEMSIGVCNGNPEDVEADLDYWINTVGQLCNWGSFIKDEVGFTLTPISGFELTSQGSYIELTWDPISNGNFEYYNIERSTDIEFSENVLSHYLVYNSFEDNELEYDTEYFYRISYYAEQWSEYSDTLSATLEWMNAKDSLQPPSNYTLYQNYPNPFNPVTTIPFSIPSDFDQQVLIRIYDIKGTIIYTLADQKFETGYHSIQWIPSSLSNGVYFVELIVNSERQVKKLILLK